MRWSWRGERGWGEVIPTFFAILVSIVVKQIRNVFCFCRPCPRDASCASTASERRANIGTESSRHMFFPSVVGEGVGEKDEAKGSKFAFIFASRKRSEHCKNMVLIKHLIRILTKIDQELV